MSEEYGEPVGDVLGPHFKIPNLLEGWTVLEGIILIKCLDSEGNASWAFRETDGINEEEVIGAMTVQLDLMRERVADQFRPEGE